MNLNEFEWTWGWVSNFKVGNKKVGNQNDSAYGDYWEAIVKNVTSELYGIPRQWDMSLISE